MRHCVMTPLVLFSVAFAVAMGGCRRADRSPPSEPEPEPAASAASPDTWQLDPPASVGPEIAKLYEEKNVGAQLFQHYCTACHGPRGKGDGIYYSDGLAAKPTDLGNGLWAYDSALYNMNSHRGVEAFRMCIASGTQISNVGFHDVDYHSGEGIDGTDWPYDAQNDSITWATTSYDVDPNANALRWGTLYNFRFQADQAPDASPRPIALRLFRDGPAGAPSTITEATVVPLGAGCCQANADCGLNQVCCDAECVECCDDSDCPGFGHPYCRLSDHTCICLTNADCGFGGTCFGGSCCFGPAAARPACRARKETLALLIETPLTRV